MIEYLPAFGFTAAYAIGILYLRRALRLVSLHPNRSFTGTWMTLIGLGLAPALMVGSDLLTPSALYVLFSFVYFFSFVVFGPMRLFALIGKNRNQT
ncbi:hypothetical protein [Thioalkalivibrio sp. XN8]|uniref:hypothetical protein n=1 Tax=Thioalkalivibrio sp. XN8 TaxID=2712863 RepID=UPI0013EB1F46|nr:hypothetical protein [Thioalkalivibrio sp. XN8]NGP53817.1 hypothetical protein [Thioalkalivibrio sp. XN8]